MRITYDSVASAPQRVYPTKDRAILLRGSKIAAIENLGATKDHFDCIDLCDNDLIKLENFPPLKNLKLLLVANNNISRISDELCDSLPNLKSLVLTSNKIETLSDLRPLAKARDLERLSLKRNPVASHEHYRLFLVHTIPSLRYLDFQRVRQQERDSAKALLGGEKGALLLDEIAPPREKLLSRARKESSSAPDAVDPDSRPLEGASKEAIRKMREAIANAKSVDEVARLEKALESGVVPAEILAEVAAESTRPPAPSSEGLPPPPPPPPPPPSSEFMTAPPPPPIAMPPPDVRMMGMDGNEEEDEEDDQPMNVGHGGDQADRGDGDDAEMN